ncbi:hypothetical protein D3C73_1328550 [compost metagenome]
MIVSRNVPTQARDLTLGHFFDGDYVFHGIFILSDLAEGRLQLLQLPIDPSGLLLQLGSLDEKIPIQGIRIAAGAQNVGDDGQTEPHLLEGVDPVGKRKL